MDPSATQLITTNMRSEAGVGREENARAMKRGIPAANPPQAETKSGGRLVGLGMGLKHPVWARSCSQF